MALTIATGFVVDDSIVVVENITRHLEMGLTPMEASIKGVRQIAFTITSISISLVAVFTPILLMGGILGRLFREFAVTLSIAILVSLCVSLTTTPMMCAYLFKQQEKTSGRNLSSMSGKAFNYFFRGYKKSLLWALRHAGLMLGVTIAILAINVIFYMKVPKGFFPQQDTGRLTGSIIASQDISFQSMS